MNRHNCIDTISDAGLSSSLPLSWQSWLSDGKNLLVLELTRAVARLRVWNQRVRSRRQLAEMDERLLRDIGLSTEQALHEAGKPFWMD